MYILFEYETEIINAPVTQATSIGLDYKFDGLYIDSEGSTCGMPHYYRKSAGKLVKAQRKRKYMVIGSNHYKKQQKCIAKAHRYTANQRKDYLEKKSTEIADQYYVYA